MPGCVHQSSVSRDPPSSRYYGVQAAILIMAKRRAQSTSRLVAPAVLFPCKEWYSGRYEPAEAPKCELLAYRIYGSIFSRVIPHGRQPAHRVTYP